MKFNDVIKPLVCFVTFFYHRNVSRHAAFSAATRNRQLSRNVFVILEERTLLRQQLWSLGWLRACRKSGCVPAAVGAGLAPHQGVPEAAHPGAASAASTPGRTRHRSSPRTPSEGPCPRCRPSSVRVRGVWRAESRCRAQAVMASRFSLFPVPACVSLPMSPRRQRQPFNSLSRLDWCT